MPENDDTYSDERAEQRAVRLDEHPTGCTRRCCVDPAEYADLGCER